MKRPRLPGTRHVAAMLAAAAVLAATSSFAADDEKLKVTLPEAGQLKDGKPVGDGWVSLLPSEKLEGWKAEKEYWKVVDGVLQGRHKGGPKHHHGYTEKEYVDFELHCVIKMTGKGANSGVCIRLNPTNYDNAPGYQVDMGPGYWGCLWEERRANMVAKFDKKLAAKIVKKDDFNHYYIIAKGHHIQAWLNGVKTIDVVHKKGYAKGKIGFQLCHGKKETNVDIKLLSIRESKNEKKE